MEFVHDDEGITHYFLRCFERLIDVGVSCRFDGSLVVA
jgi:hypothetical protein